MVIYFALSSKVVDLLVHSFETTWFIFLLKEIVQLKVKISHYLLTLTSSQTCMSFFLMGLPAFFRISYFVFHSKNKVIQIWNDMGE